jgi:hypothetical protein
VRTADGALGREKVAPGLGEIGRVSRLNVAPGLGEAGSDEREGKRLTPGFGEDGNPTSGDAEVSDMAVAA